MKYAALFLTLALAACGGGGGGSASANILPSTTAGYTGANPGGNVVAVAPTPTPASTTAPVTIILPPAFYFDPSTVTVPVGQTLTVSLVNPSNATATFYASYPTNTGGCNSIASISLTNASATIKATKAGSCNYIVGGAGQYADLTITVQ